jgi:hypothetical protein
MKTSPVAIVSRAIERLRVRGRHVRLAFGNRPADRGDPAERDAQFIEQRLESWLGLTDRAEFGELPR